LVTAKRIARFERGSTGNIRISNRMKPRGLKGNSGGKPQEDSKEILLKDSKAERTPARKRLRASEEGWRCLGRITPGGIRGVVKTPAGEVLNKHHVSHRAQYLQTYLGRLGVFWTSFPALLSSSTLVFAVLDAHFADSPGSGC
jgi:hypothetical protein